MPCLLDTCTLLWLSSTPEHLPQAVQAIIVQYRDALFVSAISGFEIGVKYRKGKLELPMTPAKWFAAVCQHHGLRELSIDSVIAIRATELPPLHADPCDRILIATAQQHRMRLLTPDPLIRQYPKLTTAWA